MKKLELNKGNKPKIYENYDLLKAIERKISEKIRSEFSSEISAIREENELLLLEERTFSENVRDLLLTIDTSTQLKVVTQIGVNGSVLNEYNGKLQRKYKYGDGYFNFISEDRNNDNKPFTIGFSCLQSIEIIGE